MTEWRISSYSNNGTCVEVGCSASDEIAVRDSKNPDGPKLVFGGAAWRAFAGSVKDGRHDLT
jgi:Domain of unknown function (DUF397)